MKRSSLYFYATLPVSQWEETNTNLPPNNIQIINLYNCVWHGERHFRKIIAVPTLPSVSVFAKLPPKTLTGIVFADVPF